MLIDDGVADGQPKACTLSKRSFGKEGIEYLEEVFRRDPFSAVRHANQYFFDGLHSEDIHRSAVRHGIQGVQQEIDEHLLE